MSDYDPDGFLMGGGTPSFKFDKIGAKITGKVKSREVRQQTDFKTGKPLFFEDGSARKQMVVTLETALRDPAIENDSGDRKVYIKGKMVATVRDAVKAAGAGGVEVGGLLTVEFSAEEPAASKNLDPTKLYTASYVSAANVLLMAGGAPAAAAVAAPAAVAPPVAAPPAAMPPPAHPRVPGAPTDAAAAAAAAFAALTPEQRAAMGI